MIIEYESRYDEDVKNLLKELQEYIVSLDKEKFNVIHDDYKEKYFKKTIDEVQNSGGKILLFKENGKIVGLIVGLIVDAVNEFDFCAPKRGRITELIVSKNCRGKGRGKILLNAMEDYFKKEGCKNIILEVFGYNEKAISFYNKNGYHTRTIDVTKNI